MNKYGIYLYLSQIDFGGTFIIGRFAVRWGSHLGLGKGHHFQIYGREGETDKFFL